MGFDSGTQPVVIENQAVRYEFAKNTYDNALIESAKKRLHPGLAGVYESGSGQFYSC